VLFGIAALIGNAFASTLRFPELGSALLFPPYAFLTAALVASPRRDWIWYIIVGSVAHAVTHLSGWSVTWVLFADVANMARAIAAAALLRWWFGGLPRLDSIGALFAFVVTAVIIAPAVGATIGAANVVLHGASPTYWVPWILWFLSNALTGLTILPACLSAIRVAPGWRQLIERHRLVEVLLIAALLLGTCLLAFLLPVANRWDLALRLYAPLPLLIWTALRYGCGGACLAMTAVAYAAILGADRGTGPFLAPTPDDNVLALQLFVFLTSLPVLCIAAVATARRGTVQLYRSLLASFQDHVAILDARGIVVETNGSWRRFAESAGQHHFDRVQVGDDYVGVCRASSEQGDITAGRALAGVTSVLGGERRRFEMEYDYEHDGRQAAYNISAEALEHADGGAVVTRSDVTARRQAQLEIEEQRREVSHLARVAVLGELSGALAHELSQPLAAILANADAARRLLVRRPGEVEEVREILREIISEDQRAGQVIHRLRALLKRGETRLQPVDTSALVREVLELAHAELITRRVTATAVVDPRLPLILGDRVQLQQVLLNLILNACEAMNTTPAADRTLGLAVRASTSGGVQISVSDRGTGIPHALADRLFEPFVTTKREGLGLGLSISRAIVTSHGGRIWAENNDDRGATLHCLLVLVPADMPVERAPVPTWSVGRGRPSPVPRA